MQISQVKENSTENIDNQLKGKVCQLSYERSNEDPNAVPQSINILIFMSKNSRSVMRTKSRSHVFSANNLGKTASSLINLESCFTHSLFPQRKAMANKNIQVFTLKMPSFSNLLLQLIEITIITKTEKLDCRRPTQTLPQEVDFRKQQCFACI